MGLSKKTFEIHVKSGRNTLFCIEKWFGRDCFSVRFPSICGFDKRKFWYILEIFHPNRELSCDWKKAPCRHQELNKLNELSGFIKFNFVLCNFFFFSSYFLLF